MNPIAQDKKLSCAAALAIALVVAAGAWAQPKSSARPAAPAPKAAAAAPQQAVPAPAATPAPAAAPASAADALEDRLMSNLASRDLETLLGFYFEKHKVPAEKQAAIKSIAAVKQIADPALPLAKKRQLLQEAVRGTDSFLTTTRDTEALMNRAALFIEHGMKSQINQIEYFGETAGRQNELNEAAEAVIKILDKAAAECIAQQEQLMAGQKTPSDALQKKWQTLDDRAQAAKWTRAFSAYGLALSYDKANPKRKQVADEAVNFLKEFEAPEYQRESVVRLQMGKLLMAAGSYDSALKKLAEADKSKGIDKFGHYEVKFFTALTQLMATRPAEADKALADLNAWCKANLAPAELKEVSAGTGLLEYRINELKIAKSNDAAEKKKFSQAGEAALGRVMKDNPRLEPVIKRMLLEKLPADADVSKLDAILLRALMARGVDEYLRAKDGPVDDKGKPVIERAIVCAKELEKRKGQPNVNDETVDEAAFLTAMFLGKLDRAPQAIEESLHYIKAHGKNKERAATVLNVALGAVDTLRKDPAAMANPKNIEMVNSTWKTAIAAGRKEYTFVYGKRLFDQRQFKEAADVLKTVPANHPAITHARFYQLSAMQEELNAKDITPEKKKALVPEIQKLAAEVNQRIDADLAKATEDQKPRLKFYKVSAVLLAADLMQDELKDHAGVLKLLEGFEANAKGMRGEEKLIGTALHLRVQSLMALGRTAEAITEVKKLVETGSKNSAGILFSMLQNMDDDYAAARGRGDKEQMKKLSAGQATLIGPLIEQTKDEATKNRYKKWQAQLVLRAARNETDAGQRAKYLGEAQTTFGQLMKLAAEGTPDYDNLRYQLALVSYELKDYKKVQQEMGQLIAQGKLGPPDLRESSPDGADTYKENPVYWEGLLRFLQANFELSKTDSSPALKEAMDNNREVLRTLYINRGKNVGGERFREEFSQLKAQMLPGWDESKVAASQPTASAGGDGGQPAK